MGMTKSDRAISCQYNADGKRISKTVNGATTEYFLNGSQILAQKTGESTIWFFYDSEGNRIGMIRNGYAFYYMYNLQGDVIGLMDARNGRIVARYTYDAWGKCTVQNADGWTAGDANPFRYRGYYYDTETGLYYLNSRYYDPEVGRFISADNAISGTGESVQGYNLFSYCFNNPVNMEDPTGNWPKWLEKAAKAVAVAAVVVTAVVVVAVATAGTGGVALAAAGVAFGTACGGLVGGIANEKRGESFINGWVGGAVNGFTQSLGTVVLGLAGTIVGGGVGSGLGTAVTESLNNRGKSKEQQKTSKAILNDSLKSAAIGTVMSTMTAGIGYCINYAQTPLGYNSWSDSLSPGVGIAPITPGFGEMMKGFFSSVDDALVYIFCE